MMRNAIRSGILYLLIAMALGIAPRMARAQVDAPLILIDRGQLWNTYYYSKTAAPFNNWARINFGLHWPGYQPEFVRADIGDPPSHLVTGGIWFTSKDSNGDVIALDDFAMYASSTTPEATAKYRVTRHERVFKDGSNHWLAEDPTEAEELIISEWEANPDWTPQWDEDRQHPLKGRREIRNWGGFALDQNYFLVEYTLTNTSDSTLYDAVAMISYAFSPNARAWDLLFPGYTSGVRNAFFQYFAPLQTVAGFMDDFPETPGRNERLGFYPQGGPHELGEFLAPAYVGLRVLDVTQDRNGRAMPINRVAWMPADDQQDQNGPFVGKTGFEQQYEVVEDALNASNAVATGTARNARMWTLISLGPWDLEPGESISIVLAEVIGGADYADVIALPDRTPQASVVAGTSSRRFLENANRAAFVYQNDYQMPKPPPAPPVEVKLYDDPGVIANVVSWSDEYDTWRDPDYVGSEAEDLAGYRLYRSNYLPFGPWELVVDVPRGSPDFYDAGGGAYSLIDSTVAQGFSYYYALTAYDTGHDTWPINPSVGRVPSLESSLFANRTLEPFAATIPAASALDDVLVVPNPFIARSGFVNPGDADVIQFVNIPSPATVRIYTMRGNLVKTIEHDDGSGITFWDQVTDYGQFVESGVYIYHVETPEGHSTTGKFAIIR